MDQLKLALSLLSALVEFAENQEKEGLIDGACDLAIYVDRAKILLARHAGKDDSYAERI